MSSASDDRTEAGASDRAGRRPRIRDRRGRGLRGPEIVPVDPGHPVRPGRRQRFDDLVLRVIEQIDHRWSEHLGLVEYAVEDAPQVPDDWHPDTVPLSSLIRGTGADASRLVIFRRPIEHRSDSPADLHALIHTVLVEQIAELLGLPVDEVDPGYDEP